MQDLIWLNIVPSAYMCWFVIIIFLRCVLISLNVAQAVLKQFGAGGYGGSDNVITDEAELQQHQKLEKLYISTRAGKVA